MQKTPNGTTMNPSWGAQTACELADSSLRFVVRRQDCAHEPTLQQHQLERKRKRKRKHKLRRQNEKQTSQTGQEPSKWGSDSGCPKQAFSDIESSPCSRLLPDSDESEPVDRIRGTRARRNLQQHRQLQRHPLKNAAGASLLLSLVVSIFLGAVVLGDNSLPDEYANRLLLQDRRPDDDRGDSSRDKHNGLQQQQHQYQQQQQHTDCPHRSSQLHKSHQPPHHQYHVNQATSAAESRREHERLTQDHYHPEADLHSQPPTNEHEDPRRTDGLASVGPVRDDNRDEQRAENERRPEATQSLHQTIESGSTCIDCLAIPLVALVGDKQISGFIIPPPSLQRGTRERQSNHLRSMQPDPLAPYDSRRPSYALSYEQHYKSAPVSLEPKSDESCPMTGPLTVCDHINSYPTDVILEKLDSAKRQLGEAHFNLDSLFSDERENSGDPFERPAKVRPTNNSTITMALVRSIDTAANSEYSSEPSANIYSHLSEPSYQEPQRQTSANKRYSGEQRSRSRSADLEGGQGRAAAIHSSQSEEGRPSAAEDFADLVERQAFSLADRKTITPSESIDQEAASIAETVVHQKQHPPRRSSAAAKRNQRSKIQADPGSILTSSGGSVGVNATAVATATGGRRTQTNGQTKATKIITTNGSYDSGRRVAKTKADEGAEPTTVRRSDGSRGPSGANPSRESRLSRTSQTMFSADASARNSLPTSTQATQTSRGRLAEQQSALGMIARRSRRQVGSVRVSSSSGGPMLAADSPQRNPVMGETDSDDDNSAAQDDGRAMARQAAAVAADSMDNQAEPVCQARSIYISPRAALNDKKQWKYVVNAPERNPQIRQIIRVDICQNPFGPCSGRVSLPFGFASECKQKYSKKKLLALDAKSGLLEVDTFFIPSCCVCQLIRTDSISPEESPASLEQPPAEGMDGGQPQDATEPTNRGS